MSPHAYNLMFELLEKDPKLRPSAKLALWHPWFKEDREAIDQAIEINDHFILGSGFSKDNSNLNQTVQLQRVLSSKLIKASETLKEEKKIAIENSGNTFVNK